MLLSVYFCENRGVTREKNQVKVPVKKKIALENFHLSTREVKVSVKKFAPNAPKIVKKTPK